MPKTSTMTSGHLMVVSTGGIILMGPTWTVITVKFGNFMMTEQEIVSAAQQVRILTEAHLSVLAAVVDTIQLK